MQSIIEFIQVHTNWYVVIALFAIIIKAVTYIFKPIQNKELKKRKLIIKEIELLKEKYKGGESKQAFGFMDLFTFQHAIKEEQIPEFKKESNEIVQKHKGKPILIVLPFLINVFFFVIFISYLKGINEIDNHFILPIVTTILTFFSFMTRKQVLFPFLIACLSYWFYARFSGAINLFILMNVSISLIEKTIKMLREKKKEKEIKNTDDIKE